MKDIGPALRVRVRGMIRRCTESSLTHVICSFVAAHISTARPLSSPRPALRFSETSRRGCTRPTSTSGCRLFLRKTRVDTESSLTYTFCPFVSLFPNASSRIIFPLLPQACAAVLRDFAKGLHDANVDKWLSSVSVRALLSMDGIDILASCITLAVNLWKEKKGDIGYQACGDLPFPPERTVLYNAADILYVLVKVRLRAGAACLHAFLRSLILACCEMCRVVPQLSFLVAPGYRPLPQLFTTHFRKSHCVATQQLCERG